MVIIFYSLYRKWWLKLIKKCVYLFTDDLTITPTDTRWVGAWWIGFLICAGVNVLTAIPFFFLPKTLPKEGLEDNAETIKNDKEKQGDIKKERDGITKGKYKHKSI